MGDLASLASRISCVPWQSVQTAAFSEPAATACPWTLCAYEATICALCPLSCITNFWLWQAPQVAGIFEWCTRDFGSLAGSNSCGLPWQSTHVAALLLPPWTALPWKLRSYAACSSAWQVAQVIFRGGVSCAELFTSVWQSTQVNMLPWMESLKPCGSTCKLTVLPLTSWVSVASLWQARHSSAAGLGGCLPAGGLPAARSVPAVKSRVRATPGAKIFRIVRVDMLSPANLSESNDLQAANQAAYSLIT